MDRQAVYGILLSQDKKKVLLVERRDLPVFVLPGGGLDFGESPEQGAQREVEEEIGCKVEIVRKIAEYLPVNRLTQKTHFFEYKIVEGAPKATEETRQALFFPINDLPSRLPPPFPGWIQDALLDDKNVLVKKIQGVTYLIFLQLLLLHPILIVRYLLTKIGIRFNKKK